jgi:hypothetical protein
MTCYEPIPCDTDYPIDNGANDIFRLVVGDNFNLLAMTAFAKSAHPTDSIDWVQVLRVLNEDGDPQEGYTFDTQYGARDAILYVFKPEEDGKAVSFTRAVPSGIEIGKPGEHRRPVAMAMVFNSELGTAELAMHYPLEGWSIVVRIYRTNYNRRPQAAIPDTGEGVMLKAVPAGTRHSFWKRVIRFFTRK